VNLVGCRPNGRRRPSNRHAARRQKEDLAERDHAIAATRGQGYAEGAQETHQAPAPASGVSDITSQLTRLAALRDQGIRTEEEFTAKKAPILGSWNGSNELATAPAAMDVST